MKVAPINLKVLAYILTVEGHDTRSLLQHLGLEDIEHLDDGEWLPLELFDRSMAVVVEASGDPGFGLRAGKSIALMRYGLITPLTLFTPSLRQALQDLRRFGCLYVPCSELLLDESDRATRIALRPLTENGLSARFRTEFVATSAAQLLQLMDPRPADILRFDFPYPCPDGMADRYAAAFGPNVFFGQKECAVTFEPGLLDKPAPMHDPVAYVAARTRADSALAAIASRTSVAEKVRQALLNAFPRQPAIGETARQLGMSERTLRRHLSLLDTTYLDLAQECQHLMAERLLAEGRLPIKQIADALGFGSVSTFHRAFRRWTGLTPLAWQHDRARPAASLRPAAKLMAGREP